MRLIRPPILLPAGRGSAFFMFVESVGCFKMVPLFWPSLTFYIWQLLLEKCTFDLNISEQKGHIETFPLTRINHRET